MTSLKQILFIAALLFGFWTSRSFAQTYNDAVVGYALVEASFTPPTIDDYHSFSYWDIFVTRNGLGDYTVTFEDAGGILEGGGHVQVNAVDTHALCHSAGWSGSPDLYVRVKCNYLDGNPVDSWFTVLVLHSWSPVSGNNPHVAFAWSTQEAPTGHELDLSSSSYAHNPSGGSTTLFHDADGIYRIVFEDLLTVWDTGAIAWPLVTSYDGGFEARDCAPTSQQHHAPSADDVTITVLCGAGGSLSNRRFNLLLPRLSNEAMAPGYTYLHMDDANVGADWTEFSGSRAYNPYGTIEVRQPSIGDYWVRFNGLNGGDTGGNAIVTPTISLGPSCEIENISATAGNSQTIEVECFHFTNGSPNHTTFALLSTFPNASPVADEATPFELADVLTAPAPNPAHGISTFSVAVETGQNVSVKVFDTLGRRMQTLYDAPLATGMAETLELDASALPAGVYVIRAMGESFAKTRRVTVIR